MRRQISFQVLSQDWRLTLWGEKKGHYTIAATNVKRLVGGVIYHGHRLPEARGVFNFLAKQDLSVITTCVRTSGLKD